jgi:hypothetical protein
MAKTRKWLSRDNKVHPDSEAFAHTYARYIRLVRFSFLVGSQV